jgi:hypothetical protein
LETSQQVLVQSREADRRFRYGRDLGPTRELGERTKYRTSKSGRNLFELGRPKPSEISKRDITELVREASEREFRRELEA